jgi:hypothetical protein
VDTLSRAANGQAREHGLRARLSWITGLRLVFLTLFLGAIAFFYLGGELTRFPVSMRVVLGAIASSYALGAAYATVLRTGRRSLELAYVQIVFDQVVWTAIVYVSGGPASGATAFYGLTCLTGAILVGKRGAFLAAQFLSGRDDSFEVLQVVRGVFRSRHSPYFFQQLRFKGF